MNLIGQRVKHKTMGSGTIVSVDDAGRITVEFPTKTTVFQYPLAFEKFLSFEEEGLMEEVNSDLSEKKDALEKEKAERYASFLENYHKIYGGGDYKEKKYVPVKREEGRALTFYVFQGGVFDVQSKEQYIWAPLYAADGENRFYWENIMNLRQGDVILHGVDGYVKAVSRVKDTWYPFDNPNHIFDNPIYKDGRRVDCEYTIFKTPVPTWEYRDEIIKYSSVKYAPFDKNGNGNQGYLYDLDKHLASILLKAAIDKNKEIADLDYIQWLLNTL